METADMLRHWVVAVLGCLYVALSVCIVRSEGDSYRKSIRRATTATQAAEQGGNGSLNDQERTVAQPASTGPSIGGSPAKQGGKAGQSLAASATERKMPRADSSNPSLGPEQVAPAPSRQRLSEASPPKEQDHRAPTKPPVQASGNSPAVAANAARDHNAIWDQAQLKKNWDLAHIKTDDEFELGLQLQQLILQFNPRVAAGSWQRRVEEAAEPLLDTVNRKDVRYTFTVLDSDQANAFSHPGGFIYVTRGLLEMIGEDEEDALQFAVGHEMAHIDLKHAIKALLDPGVMKLKEGTLKKLYMLIIPFAFLDAQEYEADEWVFRRMKRSGRSDRECLKFLNKLDSYARREGYETGRGAPKLDADSSPLDNHLRAHTAPYKRLKHLKEVIAKTSSSPK